MLHEEAASALAADPAALVWAGRDFDALAATVRGPNGERVVREARATVAKAADMPARLAAVRDGIAAVVAVLAAFEKERAEADAFIAERDRAFREAARARQVEEDRRERTYRATFPACQALKARVADAARDLSAAASVAELEAALESLAADFKESAGTFREIGVSLFGRAA